MRTLERVVEPGIGPVVVWAVERAHVREREWMERCSDRQRASVRAFSGSAGHGGVVENRNVAVGCKHHYSAWERGKGRRKGLERGPQRR